MDDFRRRPVNRVARPDTSADSLHPRTPAPTARSAPKPFTPPTQPGNAPHGNQSTPVVGSPLPIDDAAGISAKRPKRITKKRVFIVLSIVVSLIIAALGSAFIFYNAQLTPVNKGDTTLKVVRVESGSTPAGIAQQLEDADLIRSATVFLWYTRFEGVQNNLQAGTYRLSPSESTPEIVDHLVSGRVDMINVTLFPGATLVDKSSTPDDKKYDVTTALKRAGYTDQEIAAGLSADYSEYNSTLFQGRPASADLEGYIFGETYRVAADATVEDILRTSFDHLWAYIQENGLVAQFEAQGLNLYQAITLASIVQREASQGGEDMPQIAQVFYSRLAIDMELGSDVTYQYIADKTGVPRDTNLDSPYNTRRYQGLPPGPISVPGEKALSAVASPAEGEFLYFLSGDDDVTYFGKTFEEHQRNIVNHCQIKCQIL